MLLNFIGLRLFTVVRESFCTSYRSAISVEINYIFINIRDNSYFVGNCVASQKYSNRDKKRENTICVGLLFQAVHIVILWEACCIVPLKQLSINLDIKYTNFVMEFYFNKNSFTISYTKTSVTDLILSTLKLRRNYHWIEKPSYK